MLQAGVTPLCRLKRRERVSVSALGRLFDAVNAWYEAPKPPLPPLSQTLEVFQRMVQQVWSPSEPLPTSVSAPSLLSNAQAKKNSVTWNCYLNWASKVNQWYKAQEGMGAPDDGLRSCGTLSCLGPCGFVVPLYSAGKGRQRPGKVSGLTSHGTIATETGWDARRLKKLN